MGALGEPGAGPLRRGLSLSGPSYLLLLAALTCCSPPRTEGMITASLTVASLPVELVLNQAEAESGTVEYSWLAVLDTSNDQLVGEGDVALAYYHRRSEGAAERKAPIDSLRAEVVYFTSDARWETAGQAALGTGDATITLLASTSEHEALERVNRKTWVHFEVSAFDPTLGSIVQDQWPGPGLHGNPTTSGSYRDREGDAALGLIDLTRMRLTLDEGSAGPAAWRPGGTVVE